jgi:hypothetical protein
MENGHERGQVGEMAAAVIGVVEEDDVPGADLRDGGLDGAGREGQRADVNRDVVRLRHQPAVLVADRHGEVAAGVEDLRVGGAQHRFAHLGDNGGQAMLDDGAGNRVDGHGASDRSVDQSVKTTVLRPFRMTRSSRWCRTARARTRRSMSRPLRTRSSGVSR